MKYYLGILFIFFAGCKTGIKYPDGGFDYPSHIVDKDTNFYFYQLKEIEPRKDAFQDSYAHFSYQQFDEPNLSIKPRPKDTFRLTFSTAFGATTIISVTENLITIKKGSILDLYDFDDTSRLSAIENLHLKILERWFPFDTAGKRPYTKHYLDSLTKLYPQLLDPAYYHKLYDKTFARNTNKFTYSVTKIILTNQQYDSLIQQINLSGFWSMLYKVDCKDHPFDGYGFSLEANTAKKYKIVRATAGSCDTTNFFRACQKIVDLAKLEKELNLFW
jgi:hypothetical protein